MQNKSYFSADPGESAPRLESLFRAFVEESSDAFFFKDAQNRYHYINAAGARMLSRRPEEVIGRTDAEIFSRETAEKMWARDRFLMRGIDACRTYEDEDEIGGRRVVFQTSKRPVRGSQGEVLGLVGFSRDITAERAREEERQALIESLSEAKRQLEEERELRQKLVANLGHDLRSPLSVAKMATQLIEGSSLSGDAACGFLGRLRCALDRVDAMVRDLLDFSRVEAGHGWPFRKTKLDLRAVLLDSLHSLAVIYPERLEFSELDGMGPIEGVWEKSALQRVLENLVHNAIRHGDPGSPVTVSAKLYPEERTARFSVHNHGEPIRLNAEDLFERFRRGRTLRPGWGLGLTIVKSLVDGHNGKIHVESSAEAGTRFTVYLPLDG